ncbi:class I adenylate-forming enzyme family protein [Streptomyces colonosanans]|uniref:Long-chain acyl-CoA synthetase n=1 Tax=Streptomyces colonosanans TaxID=1428652 RepID=A0A1S2NU95_9ACTN|nr:class I adenylate-forming enzyme family protein [Streptomyces colonosanans]OIJ85109.1 long-chain acyl-CoA synthetase [Streptomyces colonosanans]
MKPLEPGPFFDVLADRGTRTLVHLSRALDIAPDGRTSYGIEDLAELVAQAAGWLTALGVTRGDRVAVIKPNHWDYVLLACAAARIGAVPALISDRLPAETLQLLLKRLDATALVTTAGTLASTRSTGTDLSAFTRRTLTLDASASGAIPLADVRGHRPPPAHHRPDDAPLAIMHTSGTTGIPKLVTHTTATLIHRIAAAEARRWPIVSTRRDDTVAQATSYAHGRGLAWTVSVFWLAPREAVILDGYDPGRAEPVLRAHPPTALEAAPSAFVRWQPLTASPDNPFRDVRLYINTFDAIHPPTVRAFLGASRRRLPLWVQVWGQSETGPLTFRCFTRRSVRALGKRHPTTRDLGRPVAGKARLRVVDPQTLQPVPRGRPGLVLARTRALCAGYVGETERLRAKFTDDWFATGDLGVATRSGRLLLLDREVDTVRGGSCVEIEDVLHDRLPEVVEAVVLGRASGLPLPVLVTRDGKLDRAAWRRAVADLPPLDEPTLLPDGQLPLTATGKVRRQELRDRLLDGAPPYGTGHWT